VKGVKIRETCVSSEALLPHTEAPRDGRVSGGEGSILVCGCYEQCTKGKLRILPFAKRVGEQNASLAKKHRQACGFLLEWNSVLPSVEKKKNFQAVGQDVSMVTDIISF